MTQTIATKAYGSDMVTAGVRVRVKPHYIANRSNPADNRFLFAYSITITNETTRAVRVIARRWHIVDADGQTHEVEGPGVVGQQPRIMPGESFEYSSTCPLTTPWGTMEGAYTIEDADGATFPARIGRFYLVSPHAGT
jgi:ApaG protein